MWKRIHWWLVGIVVVGFSLRVSVLNFGFHVDEPNIVERAMAMANGEWHQAWYHWPAQSLMHIYALLFKIFGDSYPLARLVSVVFDLGTVVLVWSVVKKLTKESWIALLGAGWYALSAFAIQHARYATPDTTLTFILALLVWCAVTVHTATNAKQRERYFLLMGAALGFGIATKYTAAAGVVVIALAYSLQKKLDWRPIMYVVFATLAMHTLMNPFALGDLGIIQQQLSQEANPVRLGQDWNGQWHVFKNIWYYLSTLPASAGTILIWLGYAGWVSAVVAMIRQRKWSPVGFPVVMFVVYLFGISLVGLHWSRWALPLLPPIVMLGSVFVYQLWNAFHMKTARIALIVVLVLAVIPQIISSVLYAYSLTQPTTSEQVAEWFSSNETNAVLVIGEVEDLQLPEQFTYTYRYGGNSLQQYTLDELRALGFSYVVVRTQDIQQRADEPEQYGKEIKFDTALKQKATKLFVAKKVQDTVLQTDNDYEFYIWWFEPKHWSKVTSVNQGEGFAVYQL